MEKGWFVIKDLGVFIESSRILVFNSFGSKNVNKSNIEDMLDSISASEQEELDKILSFQESENIIKSLLKKQINKKTLDTRYILNEELYIEIIGSLNDRMISNILNGLVNKGLIETAYDEKSNDFIFWTAKNDKEKKYPETC